MAVPRYLTRPTAANADADPTISLPYGLAAADVVDALNDIYAFLHALNSASVTYGYERLEELLLPAAFSGMMSELAVRAVARATDGRTPGLVRNRYPGGRPDLVPRGIYAGDAVLRGADGIEVKASRYGRGWQGHNAEEGSIMVCQFSIDAGTLPVYDRAPTTFERVMVAQLVEADWTFSGRSPTSRRTPTASINNSGYEKLAAGTVYQRGRGTP